MDDEQAFKKRLQADPQWMNPVRDGEVKLDMPGALRAMIVEPKNHMCGGCYGVGARFAGEWAGFVFPHHEIDKLYEISQRIRGNPISEEGLRYVEDPKCKEMVNHA